MADVVAKVFDVHNDLFQQRAEVMLAPGGSRGKLTLDYENLQRVSTAQVYRMVLDDGREAFIFFNSIFRSDELDTCIATFVVFEPFALPKR